jgi:hypothetical protein
VSAGYFAGIEFGEDPEVGDPLIEKGENTIEEAIEKAAAEAVTGAHEAVLQKCGVSPYSVYHPEVIQQFSGWFNQGFKDFWGLK